MQFLAELSHPGNVILKLGEKDLIAREHKFYHEQQPLRSSRVKK